VIEIVIAKVFVLAKLIYPLDTIRLNMMQAASDVVTVELYSANSPIWLELVHVSVEAKEIAAEKVHAALVEVDSVVPPLNVLTVM